MIEKRNADVAFRRNKRRRKLIFQLGDLVSVYLRKERFPSRTKLEPRSGPFQVLERVNDNAYKINLPRDYQMNATFNVCDLSPYDSDVDSRTNHVEEIGIMRAKATTMMSSTKGRSQGRKLRSAMTMSEFFSTGMKLRVLGGVHLKTQGNSMS